MKTSNRFTPPLFRLYQAQKTGTVNPDDLKRQERRGNIIHLFYDFFMALAYSVVLMALTGTISRLPMNWPRQILQTAFIFLICLGISKIWKVFAVVVSLGLAGGLVYIFFTGKVTMLLTRYVEPIGTYFYNMGSHMSGFEIPGANPAVYALWLGAGIALGSAIFAFLTYHPWLQLIAAGTVYGFSLKEPRAVQTVYILILIALVFLRLGKRRDFATVSHKSVVRRARIASKRYLKTAAPIVILLMIAVFLFQWLLPPDVFYNKTLDDLMTQITGIRLNEDESIGYYEFSIRNAGFYPLDVRLGGPVTPNNEPYMEVISGQNSLYLRGAAYTTYTGQLWQQDSMDPNWQFNHSRNGEVQRDVIGVTFNTGFDTALGYVEPAVTNQFVIVPLREQQVVFNGGRLTDLSYVDSNDAMNAYFNIAGTMYSNLLIPDAGYVVSGETFRVDLLHSASVLQVLANGYAANQVPRINRDGNAERWLQRPDMPELAQTIANHDARLYELVYGEPTLSQAERVLQIREILATTMTYSLDVAVPPEGVDFVTWFFQTKEGYCTYFGTALAVLLREAGIPARYVEGFLVPAVNGGGNRLITGEQAHAWTEVWFPGIGWLPFDATPQSTLDDMNQEEEIFEEPTPTPEPPTPELTPEITPEPEWPDQEDPIDDTPSFWQTLLSILLMIFKWLLYVSPLLAYLVWRVIVWKRRHDIPFLVKRFAGKENELVIAVWEDMKAIWALRGEKMQDDETVREFFSRVVAAKKLDLDPSQLTYESIEKALYSAHPLDNRELVDLLVLYRRAEQKAKANLPLPIWLFKRFLWSPKHPL